MSIDPTQHERLCAYVFGELQGDARATFEAELLRSPALRCEKEQLEATVGLVKRAVPDEGLSADVRRELLASARRSRFRFVPGRRMLQLVAACVVIAGGLLVWRQRGLGTERSPEIRDGAHVARVEAPAELVERKLEGRLESDAMALKAGPAGPQANPAMELENVSAELRALGYTEQPSLAVVELPQTVLPGSPGALLEPPAIIDRASAPHELRFSAGTPVGTTLAPESASDEATAQAVSLGTPVGAGNAGHHGTGAPSAFASRRAGGGGRGGKVALPTPSPSAGGAYRGPSDTKPPRREASGSWALAPAVPSDSEGRREDAQHAVVQAELEALKGLGYVGDSNEGRREGGQDAPVSAEVAEALDGLGYGSGDDGDESKKVQESAREQRAGESRERTSDGPLDALGLDVAAQVRAKVAQAEVEQILGACRVGAGESPGAMFFRTFGEAPFVVAREERISTFAADVDTASYALARAYLNQGQLPPREAVRTEEFVNYFKADQPPPADGQPFALGLELAPSLFGGDARAEMLRVSVRGKDVADFERQPLALTFVIDNSGSMASGDRLELVKRALGLLLRQLYASDSVAIVKFSNTAAVVTPMIQATRRGELEGLIAGLPIEGGTNVEAGLRLGYEQALQTLQRRGVNRVILCSDGVGNIGETSAKGLLALVEDARKQGIYLNTVGVGMGNHDDAFLEELADKGDGVCHYVDSDAEAKRVFVDALASLVQPIARDVKIQVEFDPAQVESWRLLGYENRSLRTQDFRNDAIDAGEVNAGHQVSALYELVRRPGTGAPLATARLRFKPPFAIDAGKEGGAARAEAEQALEIERTVSGSDVLPGFASASGGYQRAVLAAQFAEVLRRSVHARSDSFATLLSESRRLAGQMGDPDVAEFVTLLERANPLLDALTKEETSRVQQLLEQLGRLHYEQALRERQQELAKQAGEPELAEEARHDLERVAAETRATIQRLESELRTELYRARGVEPPGLEPVERLRQIGYGGDK